MLRRAVFFLMACVIGADASAQTQPGDAVHYWLLDSKGAVSIVLGQFRLTQADIQPDDNALRIAAADQPRGMYLSLMLKKAPRAGTSAEVRNEWWDKRRPSPFQLTDVKKSDRGSLALVDYIIPEYQGQAVQQKNVHAFFAAGEVWGELHISKVEFKSGDEKLFDSVLETVKLDPDYAPGSRDYFGLGSYFYEKADYGHAAIYYQQALDEEKQSRSLDSTFWKVLIDNLGISYGISGNLARSKSVLEYGISVEPKYPLFYYNLACAYAELNDLDNAIVNLKKAFELKSNILPGEKMPDPASDDSFQRYLGNKKFQDALAQLPRS